MRIYKLTEESLVPEFVGYMGRSLPEPRYFHSYADALDELNRIADRMRAGSHELNITTEVRESENEHAELIILMAGTLIFPGTRWHIVPIEVD